MTTEELLALNQVEINALKEEVAKLKVFNSIIKKSIPYIYTQKNGTHGDGIYDVQIPSDHLVTDSIIYFLPYEHSIDGQNKLRIYRNDVLIAEYLFVKENIHGVLEPIGLGMIVPNRVAFLRLISVTGGIKKAVILNAAFETNASFGQLVVNGPATFKTKPILADNDYLVSGTDLALVINSLSSFMNLIKVGTESPDVALENASEGTIYFQVGEDYVAEN